MLLVSLENGAAYVLSPQKSDYKCRLRPHVWATFQWMTVVCGPLWNV